MRLEQLLKMRIREEQLLKMRLEDQGKKFEELYSGCQQGGGTSGSTSSFATQTEDTSGRSGNS